MSSGNEFHFDSFVYGTLQNLARDWQTLGEFIRRRNH